MHGTIRQQWQLPPLLVPDYYVLDRASLRVAADVHTTPERDELARDELARDEPEQGEPSGTEHQVISIERTATHPQRSRDRTARSSRGRSNEERTDEDWAQQRRLEFDEQMRQHFPDWEGSWCPLVLSFDGQPVQLDAAPNVRFETGGPITCGSTDWPTARTPWLVRDLDASGTIDGGHELFGTSTRMADGTLAANGFAALGELDGNGDGSLTPADPDWSSLALWSDLDRDRTTEPGELRSLDEAGVRTLVLEHAVEPQCDARGNCMIERSSFEWVDHQGDRQTGALIDVHLACRRAQP